MLANIVDIIRNMKSTSEMFSNLALRAVDIVEEVVNTIHIVTGQGTDQEDTELNRELRKHFVDGLKNLTKYGLLVPGSLLIEIGPPLVRCRLSRSS